MLRALLYIFSLQKAAVGGDLLLKPGLYVEKDVVFLVLAFCVTPDLHQLGLQGAQHLLGQTGDPKRQKASFAKRGGTRPSTNQVLSVSGGLSGPLPPITADRDHCSAT